MQGNHADDLTNSNQPLPLGGAVVEFVLEYTIAILYCTGRGYFGHGRTGSDIIW